MKKHFYSHIVSIETLVLELRVLGLSQEEIEELTQIAEETLHHKVLDMLLSHLNEEDKKIFLIYLVEEPHLKTWNYILEKVENAGDKILSTAKELETVFLKDIHSLREQHK